MMNKLSKSFEDYLEAIYLIQKKKDFVRVNDIAYNLKVSLPSVTIAIKKLADKGLVIYEKYGLVKLTKQGIKIAKNVYRKHRVLAEFFENFLRVDKKTALRDACIMEHGLSKKTLNKLENFLRKLKGGDKNA